MYFSDVHVIDTYFCGTQIELGKFLNFLNVQSNSFQVTDSDLRHGFLRSF